jgi:pyruvate dehydrogenase E2 component (dihydrolipoamide acetyltransferase)
MSEIIEIRVPDIGSYSSVEIIEAPVKAGDSITAEDTIITLETEKASMDVPSPVTGKIKEMKVKLGDKISKGDLIALVEVEGQAGQSDTAENKSEKSDEKPAAKSDEKPAEKTAEKPAAPAIQEIKVPDIGNYSNVEVIEVSIKEGDEVKKEDTLITLETEKAAMDVPCPMDGKITSLKVKKGDKISQGDIIALIQTTGAPAADTKASTEKTAQPAAKAVAPTTAQYKTATTAPTVYKDFSSVHAGPATRRLAREFGIDLTQVIGSGPKNRIITQDLQNYVKSILQGGGVNNNALIVEKAPEVDFSQFGEIEVQPLSRIKKWTAKNLHRNWVTIPHITQFDEADITELEVFRQENKAAAEAEGIKLTPLAFIIKAVVSALKTYPQFNSSLAANQTDIIMKKYFHMGIAVDTPNGLVVPVVRNVDTKGLFEIARELGELSSLARAGKLKAAQMAGSCFTISSLGNAGGTGFTPIINAPDVAILGISKAQIKPVYKDNQLVPCKMLPLSLSYDHRVIDGVEGAHFMTHIVSQLQEIRKLLF